MDILQAAQPGQYLFKKLTDLWSSLDPATKITLIWCPGHSGVWGNDIADEKANEAVTTGLALPFPLYSNITKAKREISNECLTPQRRLKANIPAVGIQASAILNQLDSGCCSLNSFLFQIRKVADPSCPKCRYCRETTTHYFHFCPAYMNQRKILRKNLRKDKISYNPSDLSSALRRKDAWPALETFIRSSNRFDSLHEHEPSLPPSTANQPRPKFST